MRLAYPVAQIRQAEEPLIAAASASGDPDAVMRRAAAGVASASIAMLRPGPLVGRTVLLLVGAGNNGGDALFAGVKLLRRGCAVQAVLLAPERTHQRGLSAFSAAGGSTIGDAESLRRLCERVVPDLAIDGIVGLGGRGPLSGEAARVVTLLEFYEVPILAIDVPSGTDPDSGVVYPAAVRAAATVTFGALRRAHLLASPQCGSVKLVDIGPFDIDSAQPGTDPTRPGTDTAQSDTDPAQSGVLLSMDPSDAGALWPIPGPEDDKYTQGVVAIRAGSARYPGAAVLSTAAAVAATSGMVRYTGPCGAEVLARRPELVCTAEVREAGRAQAWVVGPGVEPGPRAVAELAEILSFDVPTILDAGALDCVAEYPALLRRRQAPLVLTPHAGEFQRLCTGLGIGQLTADRAESVRRLTRHLQDRGVPATVLLKGRVTIIDDGQIAYCQDSGHSFAATAGSGDVLSGLAGALLSSPLGAIPSVAMAVATLAHGWAARLAAHRTGSAIPIGATDLLEALPTAVGELRAQAHPPDAALLAQFQM